MNRTECKNEITSFKISVENFQLVIRNPGYPSIPALRLRLNQKYGRIEKYIDKMSGSIGMTYLKAFSNEGLLSVTNALGSVVQNLDRISGRLDGMSDDDFESLFASPQPNSGIVVAVGGGGGLGGGRSGDGGAVHLGIPPENVTIRDVKKPHREYWGLIFGAFGRWIKNHVIAGIFTGLIGGLPLAYVVYQLGWNH